MQDVKELEEKCYSEFAKFILKKYYEEMVEQKREESNRKEVYTCPT